MDLLNKIRKFLHCIGGLLIGMTISLQCFAAPVASPPAEQESTAAVNLTNTYSFKDLGWDKSVTLNPYKPNYTFYLPIAQYLNPQKAILHLKVAFSPFLTEETQLEIKFNQLFLRRIIVPGDSTQEISLDIELPLTELSADWQTLDFIGHLASTKSLCNPNNWIYISPESSITLSTQELPFNGTLNQLPFIFMKGLSKNAQSIMLLLPQNPASEELFALLRVALQFGQLAPDSNMTLFADFINQSPEKQKEHNLILIGTAEHLFNNTGLQLDNISSNQSVSKALNNNAGVILLSPSPFNPLRGVLTFTGKDYQALNKAVGAFAMPRFTKLASGKESFIDKVAIPEQPKNIGNWYEATLQDLGFADQNVSGLGRHRLSFNIPLPNDRQPAHSTVKTLITASPFSLKDHSQVTLLMNGLKQASFKLIQEHAIWESQIEADAMKPGVNKLEYIFDLHLENEQCSLANYDEVWATIYAQSQFNTSFQNDIPQAMLNQFPVPFSAEVTVIVPDHLSKEDIDNLTRLFFKLGQLIQSNPLSFKLLTSSEANEDIMAHQNIILYGESENNPWIKFLAKYLPVQLQGNSRVLRSSQEHLQLSGDNPTGLLELIPSYRAENRSILLITGDNKKMLSEAVNTLINDKTRVSLDANVAVINFDNSVELMKTDGASYLSFKNRILKHLATLISNIEYSLKNHPQILIYVLVFLIPLYIFIRRRKK